MLPIRNNIVLTAATLLAAIAGAFLFRFAHIPLAYILGSMVGATFAGNLFGRMQGGRQMRRFSQLFVGASVGAVMTVDVIETLARLFPLMIAMAIGANALGLLLVPIVSRLANIDRLTALLSCLPAGMAEMATLAHEVEADEQSVAIIHTLRVIIVLLLVPAWLLLIGHPVANLPAATFETTLKDMLHLALLLAASFAIAALATRLRVINAYIVVPTVLCVALVSVGFTVPHVPTPLLIAAQIGIGASVGLRFNFDRMRRLPRTVFGGLVSGILLVSAALLVLGGSIEAAGDVDHLAALLAAAPGGLGEMIATAGALGVGAASVAGFQLTRSIFTNILVAPMIRWLVMRKRPPA